MMLHGTQGILIGVVKEALAFGLLHGVSLRRRSIPLL